MAQVSAYDGFAAQVVPQNVEKLPLYHWRPGSRYLCIGSRDGAAFDDDIEAAEAQTFRREVSTDLLRIAQEKMATDGLCATFSSSFYYPQNLKRMQQETTGSLVVVSAGFGDQELFDALLEHIDALVLLVSGPQSATVLAQHMLESDIHVEVLLAADDEIPTNLPWERASAVHVCSSRPHILVDERKQRYDQVRSRLGEQLSMYDEDHTHSICACGETLVWRSGGRSRLDQLDPKTGRCLNCDRQSSIVL